ERRAAIRRLRLHLASRVPAGEDESRDEAGEEHARASVGAGRSRHACRLPENHGARNPEDRTLWGSLPHNISPRGLPWPRTLAVPRVSLRYPVWFLRIE